MRSRLITLTLALALVASACGGGDGSPLVATALGEEIDYDEVLSHVETEGELLEDELFRRTIRSLIVDRVIHSLAESEFGIVATEEEIDASVDALILPLMQTGITREEVLANAMITETGLRSIAAQRVVQIAVEQALIEDLGTPPDAELMQRYNAELASIANVCSSHILLATEEDAEAAIERARAGEDFAELAMELSTGPSGPNGGDLGCSVAGQFVAEFANATLQAPLGEPFGPVQTQFGYHVVIVHSREVPTFEERREELIAGMAAERGPTLWTNWLILSLRDAEISVEPEYGIWITDPSPEVLPPEAAPSTEE